MPPASVRAIGAVLDIILVVILVTALPIWPYSGAWGYYPSGGAGLLIASLIVFMLTG